MNQRLAESYEALGRTTESLMYYRRAMMMNPAKALWLQRKIIELQLAADDQAGAAASLEEYLAHPELKDAERVVGDGGAGAPAGGPRRVRDGAARRWKKRCGCRSIRSTRGRFRIGWGIASTSLGGRRTRSGTCGWRGSS